MPIPPTKRNMWVETYETLWIPCHLRPISMRFSVIANYTILT